MICSKEVTKFYSVGLLGGSEDIMLGLEFLNHYRLKSCESVFLNKKLFGETYRGYKISRVFSNTYELDVIEKEFSNDKINIIVDATIATIRRDSTERNIIIDIPSVKLKNKVHVKNTYIKYDWMSDNGFIGADDTLVLENSRQYMMFRNCHDFIESMQDYSIVDKNTGRKTYYRFKKYGVRGEIVRHRDDTGEILFYIEGVNDPIEIRYLTDVEKDAYRIKNSKINIKALLGAQREVAIKQIDTINDFLAGMGIDELVKIEYDKQESESNKKISSDRDFFVG